MKYGREIEDGNKVIVLIDVVDAPDPLPKWAATDAEWLAKQFVTVSGFVRVADDNVAGAVKQVNGTYLNPPPPAAPEPIAKTLTSIDFQDYSIAQLGVVADPTGTADEQFLAGAQRFGEIIKGVRTSTDVLYKTAEERYDAAVARDSFGKTDTGKFLALISALMKTGETEAIITNWPTA